MNNPTKIIPQLLASFAVLVPGSMSWAEDSKPLPNHRSASPAKQAVSVQMGNVGGDTGEGVGSGDPTFNAGFSICSAAKQ